jgi:hypothetical protein
LQNAADPKPNQAPTTMHRQRFVLSNKRLLRISLLFAFVLLYYGSSAPYGPQEPTLPFAVRQNSIPTCGPGKYDFTRSGDGQDDLASPFAGMTMQDEDDGVQIASPDMMDAHQQSLTGVPCATKLNGRNTASIFSLHWLGVYQTQRNAALSAHHQNLYVRLMKALLARRSKAGYAI